MSTWIFGYGSLVSPTSLASTIGRTVTPGVDRHVVRVAGYGRRWNYGSKSLRGDWETDGGAPVRSGVVVSLGLVEAPDESTNGVIFEVDDVELAELDWRESAYDRIDITDRVTVLDATGERTPDAPVAVYFPHPSSIERYEEHRDAGTAPIRRSYWDLVDEAFVELGGDHADRYRRTPAPDVPIADIRLHPRPPRQP